MMNNITYMDGKINKHVTHRGHGILIKKDKIQ